MIDDSYEEVLIIQIKCHLYTRVWSTPIRLKYPIKKIKKKSNVTCTLKYDQPPSDQKNQKNQKKNQISPIH